MSADALATVRAVGAALPGDVLSAVVAGADGLGGLRADDYQLELGVSPREAANRAWSVLTSAYAGFRAALEDRAPHDAAVGLTREKWLAILLRELGFGRVPTTPPGGLTADERQFAISHEHRTDAGIVPIHLLGWGVELDKRTPGQPGAAERAPHAMVQEFLNRTDEALWGLVSNGRKLRLLRDSSTLIGQSFVEFDLEAMFDGEVFSDFVVLFLVCHASRFETRNPDGSYAEDSTVADCWLERWRTHAAETGTRALESLSDGVRLAVEALATGFARHPRNRLHAQLVTGDLDPAEVHRGALRLVYRLLFCFVAEDRGLLLDPKADAAARARYNQWFSMARLRGIATRRRGTRHGDIWDAVRIVLDGLASEEGRPELGLCGLGGVFEPHAQDPIASGSISNDWVLAAVRHLVIFRPGGAGPQRRVDYRNLGAEELGSVYESLLEFESSYDGASRTFLLSAKAANERRSTGAFYTPTSIIEAVLDATLDPLLDEAERSSDPEGSLLAITVCDPSCGSGHFLVAAARRIAARLADVREGRMLRSTSAPLERSTLHEVVQRCIYGVDINPMAAELARVSLFLEALEPGRPLGFLDAHIRSGNALLGATPAALARGLPDEAFKKASSDDEVVARSLAKRNAHERAGQADLFTSALPLSNTDLAAQVADLDALPLDTLADVHEVGRRFRVLEQSESATRRRRIADTWCSAFLVPKAAGNPTVTHRHLALAANLPGAGQGDDADVAVISQAVRQVASAQLFHWHLEFPDVFRVSNDSVDDRAGWTGGFSCVVGNPPFLSPLVATGAKVSPERRLTRYVLGGLGGPKADESSYFLLLASSIVSASGRVGLVLPDSFLSAGDSADIRASLGQRHDLIAIWRGDGTEFEASVTTIFVVLGPYGTGAAPRRFVGPRFEELPSATVPWRDGSWAPLVSDQVESTEVLVLNRSQVLGDLCEVAADYRDQYYGLVGAVYDEPHASDDPPLVTTGLIDPLAISWGRSPTKFNKVTYQAPRVAVASLTPAMKKWAETRLRPKLLVATQGKMVEVALDEQGALLPCVPVICVFPTEKSQVGLDVIAAILLSPAVFEYLRLTKLGSGLGSGAIKVSAGDLRSLPVPTNLELVREAARLLPDLRCDGRRSSFRSLMNQAFDIDLGLGDGWDTTLQYYFGRSVA